MEEEEREAEEEEEVEGRRWRKGGGGEGGGGGLLQNTGSAGDPFDTASSEYDATKQWYMVSAGMDSMDRTVAFVAVIFGGVLPSSVMHDTRYPPADGTSSQLIYRLKDRHSAIILTFLGDLKSNPGNTPSGSGHCRDPEEYLLLFLRFNGVKPERRIHFLLFGLRTNASH